MTPTKTELLEEMQQKIATFVEGYDEDLNFNYQVDDLMNEIGEALDRYRDNVVEEERIKMFKILSDTEETYYDDGYGPFTKIVANVEGIRDILKQTNNNTTKE